jgi:mannose/cellobiose epimerase-like protein (N-acyl-D-glucosamine 2-epimerase family)
MPEASMTPADLRSFFAAMVENWAGPGWDAARLGFHERLTPALQPAPGFGYRRLHLCARQLYVLSRAPALLGTTVPAGLAETVFRLLAERFRDERHGGFFQTLDLDGAPLDRRKDLYGHAFVLFGLAAYHAASGDPAALPLARQSLDEIRRHLALPGGWFAAQAAEDWQGRDTALSQNPNMHLLEACLALEAVDPDPAWCLTADALVDVFHQHLYDPVGQALGEFYDEAGHPHPATGHWVEPGHQFEWAWLLYSHADRRGTAPPAAADALIAQGARRGTDPAQGGLWDRIDRAGGIVAETKRIWPVCEAIKAYAIRWRRRGDATDRAAMLQWLDFLGKHYLCHSGRWHEHLNRDLTPLLSDMPGTTPYHLLMMAEEVLIS